MAPAMQKISIHKQPCHSEPFVAAISGENGEEPAGSHRLCGCPITSRPLRGAGPSAMRSSIVTMRLDTDLLRGFRQQRGYQTRINAILRAYMEANHSA
ncbi:MAG: BrnA antitoxin family protein [Candidatus Sulfotelmatobacter sp.]